MRELFNMNEVKFVLQQYSHIFRRAELAKWNAIFRDHSWNGFLKHVLGVWPEKFFIPIPMGAGPATETETLGVSSISVTFRFKSWILCTSFRCECIPLVDPPIHFITFLHSRHFDDSLSSLRSKYFHTDFSIFLAINFESHVTANLNWIQYNSMAEERWH